MNIIRECLEQHEIFVDACKFLAPVIAANDPVPTVSNFAMTHMLADRFPELAQAEIHIVIETTQKLHHSEQIQSLFHIKTAAVN